MHKSRWFGHQLGCRRHCHHLRQRLEPSERSASSGPLSQNRTRQDGQDLPVDHSKHLRERDVRSSLPQAWPGQSCASEHEHQSGEQNGSEHEPGLPYYNFVI